MVRVGDTVTAKNITINNTAATAALNDTLGASLSGVSGPFVPGAAAAGIVAGGSGLISIGINTTAATPLTTQAGSVALSSHNADMSDLALGSAGVLVRAQINNLANADFDFLSGLGTLSQSGTAYTLDLGLITLGSSVVSRLQLDNDVAGPADDLSGLFDLLAADDFSYAGWGPVGPLGAGQATGNLNISFTASALGLISDTVVFNGRGTNASDPSGRAQTRTLIIRGNVINVGGTVPEPGTLALLLVAALGAAVARRRQAH